MVLLPTGLADIIINSIGVVEAQQGMVTLCPQVAAPPAATFPYLQGMTPAQVVRCSQPIRNCQLRNLITEATLTPEVTGTPWWLAGVIPADGVAAGANDAVQVVSVVDETTLDDVTRATIVQLDQDGLIDWFEQPANFSTFAHNCLAFREAFNTI